MDQGVVGQAHWLRHAPRDGLPRSWLSFARGTAIVLLAGLTACAQPGGPGSQAGGDYNSQHAISYRNEPGLTQQQQILRSGYARHTNPDYQPKVRTAQTVTEGAVAGVVAGALIGALLGGRGNYAAGAAIGATVGGAGGALAGKAVADNAQQHANREAALVEAIALANRDAQSFQNYAAAARAVAAETRSAVADLDRRYRAGQISADEFRRRTDTYRRDAQVMQSLAADADRARTAMASAGEPHERARFMGAANEMRRTTAEMNQWSADMVRTLATVPGAV